MLKLVHFYLSKISQSRREALRQQAQAIVAARRQIVDGAVGMVKLALDELREQGVVDLVPVRHDVVVGVFLPVLGEPAEDVDHPLLHVDGVDLAGPVLQHAVGEPAGRSADVGTHQPAEVQPESFHCASQLFPTA